MAQAGNFQTLTLLSSSTGEGSSQKWNGGRLCFQVKADSWGGGTVSLQMCMPDQTTWVAVGTDTTLMADGIGGAELPICLVRAVATTATGVTAWASGTSLGGDYPWA